MPVRDYEQMLAHAVIGEEVCRIVRESGLMVPRQKPGRKAEPERAEKPVLKAAVKPAKAPKAAPVETENDEDDADEDDDEE